MPLTTRDLWLAVGAIFALLVVVAGIVNVAAPARRSRLRSPVVLFTAYLGLATVLLAARGVNAEKAVPWLDFAARLAGGYAVASLFAILLVEVLLPRLRLEVPAIMADLLSALGYGAITAVVIADTGIDPVSAVAGGTVVAAVLSISLQSTFGNVIGGVALQLDGSIKVGDWIQLENGRQGRVGSISWRFTLLETRDGDSIVMPNSVLLSSPFTLLGRRGGVVHPHRQTVHFRVDYRFSPARVAQVAQSALRSTPIPNVSPEPAPDCVCLELARDPTDSTALYAARYWIVDMARDVPTDSEVRSRLHAALRRDGISMALPATTVFNADLDHLSGDAQRRRRKERAYQAVRGVELFRSLTDDECERLAASLTFCPFAPGEVITRQGAVAHFLYLVSSGRVEVRVADEGVETAVNTLDAPAFFGEMGLLTGAPRLASVYAQSSVECFKLERDAFDAILHERPEVATSLGAVLAKRQVELDAVRMSLDAAGRAAHERRESDKFAARIREFFGLGA